MTQQMFFRAVLAVCTMASLVEAAPSNIQLIQQTHTVWGNAGYPIANTYFRSDSATVTGSASGIGVSGFLGTATSTAGPDGLSAFRIGDGGSANAYAQSEYRFVPDYSRLVLDVSGAIGEWAFENLARVSLTDVTAGVLVDSYVSPHELDELDSMTIEGFAFSFQHNLVVDPTHVYELIGFVEAHRGEGGTGSAEMNLVFYSIPAPPAIFLCGFGTAVILRLRRRGML